MKMNILGKPVVGLKMRLEFVPRDLWVGVFWRHDTSRSPAVPWAFQRYDLWLCLFPCFPLHATWYREGSR